jgi:hypothetical protein
MPAPRSKGDYLRRYVQGEFGNRPLTWSSVEELQASPYRGKISVRWKELGRRSIFGISFEEALEHAGAHFNEAMPEPLLVVQGELTRSEYGWDLTYSRIAGLGNSAAMNRHPAEHARGLRALGVLQHYLPATDLDDMLGLFDRYDDSLTTSDMVVVEFSCFRTPIGTAQRKTVIWEVRSY